MVGTFMTVFEYKLQASFVSRNLDIVVAVEHCQQHGIVGNKLLITSAMDEKWNCRRQADDRPQLHMADQS
jgi:hypothetical protein